MGPFVVASKGAANREVWACNGAAVKEYVAFESKIKGRAAALGADWVVCRAGTLKGGGPGDTESPTYADTTKVLPQVLSLSVYP